MYQDPTSLLNIKFVSFTIWKINCENVPGYPLMYYPGNLCYD